MLIIDFFVVLFGDVVRLPVEFKGIVLFHATLAVSKRVESPSGDGDTATLLYGTGNRARTSSAERSHPPLTEFVTLRL